MRFWVPERVALVAASIAVGFFSALTIWPVAKRFEWETILAGVLAIAAAAWTVKVSREIDAQQERRHRDLVKLSLRAERLRARRAASQITLMEYLIHDCPQVPDFDKSDLDDARRAAGDMQRQLKWWKDEMVRLFEHRSISEAHDLFEPDTVTALELTAEALHEFDEKVRQLAMVSTHGTLAGTNEIIQSANRAASEVFERASSFLEELVSFERTYAGAD